MALSIHHFTSAEELFKYAASDFLNALKNTIKTKNHYDVALSGGGTAQKFLLVLKEALAHNKNKKFIRFFFSDERAVTLDSEDSNAGNAMRILQSLAIPRDQFFPMYDATFSEIESAHRYQELLTKELSKNTDGIPVFDMVYLGIGEDGHTASLFPHSETINQKGLVLAVHEKYLLHKRITLMPEIINAASRIVMMATGANKRRIIERIIDGPVHKMSLPAQLFVRNSHVRGALLLALDF